MKYVVLVIISVFLFGCSVKHNENVTSTSDAISLYEKYGDLEPTNPEMLDKQNTDFEDTISLYMHPTDITAETSVKTSVLWTAPSGCTDSPCNLDDIILINGSSSIIANDNNYAWILVNQYHAVHLDSDGEPYTESNGFLTLPADECAAGNILANSTIYLSDPNNCAILPQNLWTGDQFSVEIYKYGEGMLLGDFDLQLVVSYE